MQAAPDAPPPSDPATDMVVALVLGTATACLCGLALALLGRFHPLPVVLAGGIASVVGLAAARPSRHVPAVERAPRWRALEGPAVCALALMLYVPPYDTTLYGADATAYLGMSAYLARRGGLAIEAPVLSQLPAPLRTTLFPAYRPDVPAIRQRCAGGLSYTEDASGARVYSSFAKLPSVWLALGFAAAGVRGALATSTILGAAGLLTYYLFVRRTLGAAGALLAAALLASAVPQVLFARVSMAEVGAQFFLWGGLLALARARAPYGRAAAIAAGLGFGCAILARIDLLLFVPLAVLVAWSAGVRLQLPRLSFAIAAVLTAGATVLLVVLPSHYQPAITQALTTHGLARVATALRSHPLLTASGTAALGVAAAVALRRRPAPRSVARIVAGAGLALWGLVFAFATDVPPFAGARLLPHHTSALVCALAVLGTPLLARRWWPIPAARLALLIGAVATVHLLYAPHATLLPLWAGRRFVPVVLPALSAAAALAVTAARRFGRVPAALLVIATLATQVRLAYPLWHPSSSPGASAAVATIAATMPEDDALVLLDPAFHDALLDIPLWLAHEREAIQLPGAAGDLALVGDIAAATRAAGRPLYLVRHALLAPPDAPALRFVHVADGLYPIAPLGPAGGRPATTLAVRVWRVQPAG